MLQTNQKEKILSTIKYKSKIVLASLNEQQNQERLQKTNSQYFPSCLNKFAALCLTFPQKTEHRFPMIYQLHQQQIRTTVPHFLNIKNKILHHQYKKSNPFFYMYYIRICQIICLKRENTASINKESIALKHIHSI